ncbi:helix-turn-helix transcriptional regulator [Seleniivibrio woodruffii]|uniref:helix-turn-helix transcriptional regulator n=1 Tax=Seleniivibrio woodruffii TaxID=1078050 RepID=UPI0026ECC8B0|nr:AraC family transcriptional regulator [Seleniivibrio woodruffii]
MQETFPVMGIVTEKDVAVFKLRNKAGSYDTIPVSDHAFRMFGLSKYVEQLHIQSGLYVYLIDIPADVELVMEYVVDECPIGFGITLESDLHSVFYKNGSEFGMDTKKSNSLIISKSNNTSGRTSKKKGKPTQAVSIAFDRNFAKVHFRDEMHLVRHDMKDYFEDNDRFYEISTPATPMMLGAARSMLGCTISSPKRELFIKSKVFELINHVFSEFFLTGSDSSRKSVLQPGEVGKIRDLCGYIAEHLDEPPTISELAKLSGINDFKLKAGFKEVFGVTVYGFIQTERMAKAKMMLETGEYSVSDIAWTVGYTNVSHFIKAFKKHFNVTPGQMLFHVKSDITRSRIRYSV